MLEDDTKDAVEGDTGIGTSDTACSTTVGRGAACEEDLMIVEEIVTWSSGLGFTTWNSSTLGFGFGVMTGSSWVTVTEIVVGAVILLTVLVISIFSGFAVAVFVTVKVSAEVATIVVTSSSGGADAAAAAAPPSTSTTE